MLEEELEDKWVKLSDGGRTAVQTAEAEPSEGGVFFMEGTLA